MRTWWLALAGLPGLIFLPMKGILRDYQRDAVNRMKNGCILCGGVGSGKSRTALAYFVEMELLKTKKLYIITTARKRDTHEWEEELKIFPQIKKFEIDSWNNIKKYKDVTGAFFIFDEDRVTGSGVWAKTFVKLSKVNRWIILSATPGDTWMDYIPVFLANGFYRNKTEFLHEHVVFNRYSKFPQVDRFVGTKKLERLRNDILVDMDFKRPTTSHHIDIWCDYDKTIYKSVMKERWNVYEDKPCENISELCYILRKVTNSDVSRLMKVKEILNEHPRAIIFYNFDYELEELKTFRNSTTVAEWNGHSHDPLPVSSKWIYLVQYTAGAEGWNCITTDTMIFFSQNYSYKTMEQSQGRIDRMNTPFKDLYYYHLKSKSPIDLAITRALNRKQKFNESRYFAKLASREKQMV